jgi:hypothetical protein
MVNRGPSKHKLSDLSFSQIVKWSLVWFGMFLFLFGVLEINDIGSSVSLGQGTVLECKRNAARYKDKSNRYKVRVRLDSGEEVSTRGRFCTKGRKVEVTHKVGVIFRNEIYESKR